MLYRRVGTKHWKVRADVQAKENWLIYTGGGFRGGCSRDGVMIYWVQNLLDGGFCEPPRTPRQDSALPGRSRPAQVALRIVITSLASELDQADSQDSTAPVRQNQSLCHKVWSNGCVSSQPNKLLTATHRGRCCVSLDLLRACGPKGRCTR